MAVAGVNRRRRMRDQLPGRVHRRRARAPGGGTCAALGRPGRGHPVADAARPARMDHLRVSRTQSRRLLFHHSGSGRVRPDMDSASLRGGRGACVLGLAVRPRRQPLSRVGRSRDGVYGQDNTPPRNVPRRAGRSRGRHRRGVDARSGYSSTSPSALSFRVAISPSTPFCLSRRRYSDRRTASSLISLSNRISTMRHWPLNSFTT